MDYEVRCRFIDRKNVQKGTLCGLPTARAAVCGRGGVHGKPQYFLLHFAVNLKPLLRKISLLNFFFFKVSIIGVKFSFNVCPVFSFAKSSNPFGRTQKFQITKILMHILMYLEPLSLP